MTETSNVLSLILSPVALRNSSRRNPECKAKSLSIRCEQNTKDGGSGLDVWLGRLAMMGFAAGITVEVTTGKGLLEVTDYRCSCSFWIYDAYLSQRKT